METVLNYPITEELRNEILTVPVSPIPAGSGHPGDDYAGGWIGELANTRLYAGQHTAQFPQIFNAVEALLARFYWRYLLTQVMVNRLNPGGVLDKHRDGHTPHYRFHLPVITNPAVVWWDEFLDYGMHMQEGFWYGPVPHSGVLHSMMNEGNENRWHIIVDLMPPK